MNINIPTQIKDISAFQQLRKTDRQIIATAVLMGLPNQDAFRLWHPEYIDGRGGLTETGKDGVPPVLGIWQGQGLSRAVRSRTRGIP